MDTLREDLILPELRATRKPDVIRELAAHLAARHEGLSQEEIGRVLVERERLGSTAIGEGVAIPHAKLDSLEEVIVCLGRSRKGIDFDSPDGRPTHFFFVLIAPEDSAGLHLKMLARISRLFKQAHVRARLMVAEEADDMFHIIADEDAAADGSSREPPP